jgi:hypothetical protein
MPERQKRYRNYGAGRAGFKKGISAGQKSRAAAYLLNRYGRKVLPAQMYGLRSRPGWRLRSWK